jgi:hypothetical protein
MAKKIKIIQVNQWGTAMILISPWKYRENLADKILMLKMYRFYSSSYLYYIRFLKDEEEK